MNSKKNWWLLVIVSLGVMTPFVAPYLTLNPENSRIVIISPTIQYPVLIAHIVFACLALISGFLQFIKRIRLQKPKIHRFLGRLYVGSILISGLLALILVFYADNFTKAISFLVLSLIWLYTIYKTYSSSKAEDSSFSRPAVRWQHLNKRITCISAGFLC